MAENPIDIIREAEFEAEKMLHDAQQESARIKEEAYAEAAHARDLAQTAAKAAADEAISTAREKSRHILLENEAALKEELEALCKQAESRQAQAVEAIIISLV